MSLSSRNPMSRTNYRLAAALAVLLAPAVEAQQLSFVPSVQGTVEYDTNRNLSSNNKQSGEWYEAVFAADMLRTTARSELEARPEVRIQDSSISTLDRLEARLGLRALYRTQRTLYTAVANYDRQDAYNSEYGLVAFNPLNPGAPDTVGTGAIVTGITRSSYNFSPDIVHQFTERLSGELDGNFTAIRYDINIPQTLISFNAPYLELSGVYALSERAQLGIGPYYSQFDPVNGAAVGALKSRSYGADISFRYLTSQLTRSILALKVGRDDQDQFVGPNRVTTAWGLEWTGTYKWPTADIRYSIGRFIEPSSVGGEVGINQFRVQYNRRLSARFSGQASVRVTRTDPINKDTTGHRTRAYGEASLQYALSRNLVLSGGWRGGWQRLPGQADQMRTAQTHGVFITLGFHGLNPQR